MGTEKRPGRGAKKLDVLSNEILLEANEWAAPWPYGLRGNGPGTPDSGSLSQGRLPVDVRPPDGSSNIDVNVSVGTIFSILRKDFVSSTTGDVTEEAFMQKGTEQVAAGYAIYGPQTMLVLTLGDGVKGFTLDRELGSFVLTHEDITIPETTAEFAINMSNQRHWEAPVKRYVDELLAGKEGPLGKNYNMRWIASMVADVHRILTRGGIFMYPRDAREPKSPASCA